MSYQSEVLTKNVIHARIAFESMGIKYVQVTSEDETQLCDYCRPMRNSIIPLVAITQLAEHCKLEQGCCCQFEPTFDTD